MIKFNFNKNKDPEMVYNPPEKVFSFYQICLFPIPNTDQVSVRKLKYNQDFDLVSKREKTYNKKKIDKFVKSIPINRYKLYSTYDLSILDYPGPELILNANSDLLS